MGFRVQAFESRLTLVVSDLTGPAAAARLAAFAREQLADAISSGEGSRNYTRFVNGREGVAEESVRLPGPILYRFSWLDEVAEYALEFLRARSPVGPVERGHYRDSHEALVHGEVVATSRDPSAIRAANIPAGAEIVISNSMPYSRKIEVGAMRMRVPPRVYEDARQNVLRHYRQIARADLRFITRSDGYVLKGHGKRKRKDNAAGTDLTYPALVLNLRD